MFSRLTSPGIITSDKITIPSKMQAGDLEVLKDIPGYKIILKSVLKSQIQHLVSYIYYIPFSMFIDTPYKYTHTLKPYQYPHKDIFEFQL